MCSDMCKRSDLCSSGASKFKCWNAVYLQIILAGASTSKMRAKRKRDGEDATSESDLRKRLRAPIEVGDGIEGCWLEGLAIAKPELRHQFRLGLKIASGGFGQVHLLHSISGNKQYACKVLPKLKAKVGGALGRQKRHRYNTVLVCAVFKMLL